MTDPRRDVAAAVTDASAPASAVSFAPQRGRDSFDHAATASFAAGTGVETADEAAVTRAVVQALARVSRPDADAEAIATTATSLHATLVPWLETQFFLSVPVSRYGFGTTRARVGLAPDLAAALAAAGVVSLGFKLGAGRAALATWIEAFARGTDVVPDVLATRLWAADMPHVGVRWRDEAAFDDGPALDEWCAARGADAAGLAEHADLVRAFDAGPAATGAPPETDWRRLVALTPPERDRLRREHVEPVAAAVCRYARYAAARAENETDPAARAVAAAALASFAAALAQQRRFAWLRDVLAQIRPTAADVDAPWVQAMLGRLCDEPTALVLGEVLDDRGSDPADVEAVRDLLVRLPRAVEPLALLLSTLEPARSRRLVCMVLAAVAARDPGLLVQSAVGQTWYVVRNIAFVLGRIGDASVVPHLARWARHDDERVRIEVARALGRVRAQGACDVLGALLDDRDARVRQCAVWSLAALGDVTVLPRLRQRLFEDKAFRDRPAEERDDFFRTYGRLADEGAFAELQRLVSQRSLLTLGWNAELRRGAVLALGESGRPAAAEALRTQAQARDARLRDAVRAALAALAAGPRALEPSDEDDWNEPARIGAAPHPDARFRLEAEDA